MLFDPFQEGINRKRVIIQYIIRVLKGNSQASKIVLPNPERDRIKVISLEIRTGWILQQALQHRKPYQISTMKGTTLRGKGSDRGSTVVWLFLNDFSPEDEEPPGCGAGKS